MEVWILNRAEQERQFHEAAEDLEAYEVDARRWVTIEPEHASPAVARLRTLRYLILEGLIGTGPWLIASDSVRFSIDPHRIGKMGELHLYGGWEGDSPLTSRTEPSAFLIIEPTIKDRLLEVWSDEDLTAADGWAKVLTSCDLTWDDPSTIERGYE